MSSASTIRPLTRLIPAQRTSDGAGVTLYRSLGQSPFARLDPFLMLDEFGSERPDEYIAGFPAHPHRGFQTVTYMLEGHMLHEDHLGNRGHLRSGGVQWMTAGRGIIHSEMPEQQDGLMEGFQLWVNLPSNLKMTQPGWRDIPGGQVPEFVSAEGVRVRVVAGRAHGVAGAVPEGTVDPVFLDLHFDAPGSIDIELPAGHNALAYVYRGALTVGGSPVPRQRMAVLETRPDADGVRFVAEAPARAVLIAGRPLNEPIAQYGPFVMNTRDELMQAVRDYQSGHFA